MWWSLSPQPPDARVITAERQTNGAESALVQTLGTWLQLVGSTITLCGLLWAWHKASGRLLQWWDTVRDRLTALRESVASVGTQTPNPSPPAEASGGSIHATVPKQTAHLEGYVDGGTPEERLARQETENARRADEIRVLADALRDEIDQAITAERDESNALRLRDIAWAAGGIGVSIIGSVCQLIG